MSSQVSSIFTPEWQQLTHIIRVRKCNSKKINTKLTFIHNNLFMILLCCCICCHSMFGKIICWSIIIKEKRYLFQFFIILNYLFIYSNVYVTRSRGISVRCICLKDVESDNDKSFVVRNALDSYCNNQITNSMSLRSRRRRNSKCLTSQVCHRLECNQKRSFNRNLMIKCLKQQSRWMSVPF